MAKRAAPDEKPYRPLLDAELVNAALSHTVPSATPASPPAQYSPARVFEMPRGENARRSDPNTFDHAAPSGESAPRITEPEHLRALAQNLVEKFDQEKRILFTRSESQAIDRLVISLATRLNAQVKVSHVVRALVGLLLNAETEIDRRAGETGPLVRPANGDAQGLQRFEREIGRIIAAALRDARPIK
jgi:hypothetical protein